MGGLIYFYPTHGEFSHRFCWLPSRDSGDLVPFGSQLQQLRINELPGGPRFFFWCYGKRQVFFGCFIMIVTKIATSSLWIDVCVYVDTQKGYIYICTYLQVCIIKDPSHQKVIWQSRKACNLFLFSLGEF